MLQGMPKSGKLAATKFMAAHQLRSERGMRNIEARVRKLSSTAKSRNLPRVLAAHRTYQAREGESVKGARIPGSYIVWGKAGLRGDLLEVNLKEGSGRLCVSSSGMHLEVAGHRPGRVDEKTGASSFSCCPPMWAVAST